MRGPSNIFTEEVDPPRESTSGNMGSIVTRKIGAPAIQKLLENYPNLRGTCIIVLRVT